ncbi:MAG: bifunctional 5,10-methylenetetrahydrofolate dehydrogenase/5,10-methenyltetrahydrofolate cyclohydrolase [Candidatus Levybacteria bacterium]|nr:bifunctional 5,10-methylenetetrahydrofolate dehydrogenase/5,10-methenyltetrahydrofolate cyclohydrolase [Candidatus Levybacteria bacterium]
MKIDGKAIAAELFQNLYQQITLLKEKNITPHIAIILVGDNPASVSYVKRKKMKAEELGAKATILNYELRITNEELLETIEQLNNDKHIHGIIIQRPLPKHIDTESINQAVLPTKDIDAFHANTSFDMPLAKAALMLLENVLTLEILKQVQDDIKTGMTFKIWLQSKNIVVVGKGETGGGPIITLLKKYGITPTIIDSRTKDPLKLTKQADIIISAVGKENVIIPEMIKKDVILISIGQHKQKDGKFHGDYEEESIKDIAAYYSPTPGGVGPVNVACLLDNLIQATQRQT